VLNIGEANREMNGAIYLLSFPQEFRSVKFSDKKCLVTRVFGFKLVAAERAKVFCGGKLFAAVWACHR
jgi:hypothetical protein